MSNFNAMFSASSNAASRFSSTASDAQNTTSSETITCSNCGCVIEHPWEIHEFNDRIYCEDCFDSETFVCECCFTRCSKDEYNDTEDGPVCDACLVDNYSRCECCGEYFNEDNINWCEDTDDYVCEDCLESGRSDYFRCEHCRSVCFGSQIEVYYNNHSSETWCESCVENNNTYTCSECHRTFDGDYVDRFELDDRWADTVCEYCQADRSVMPAVEQDSAPIGSWKAPYGVRNYGYKPTPCFCLSEAEKEAGHDQSDTVCFGVELEMEDHSKLGRDRDADAQFMNDNLGFTYCKNDGSLTRGIELVSHPCSFEFWMSRKDILAAIFEEMRTRGYTSHDNGNCGLHVHISLKPMLEANEDAVCAMLLLIERFWSQLIRFTRRTEDQLDRWAALYSTKHKEYKELAKMSKRECGRYMAVNLRNEHTVELRIFRGTLKVETFLATLQFVKRLVDVCITADEAALRSMTWEELTDTEYPELKAYLAKRFNPQPVTFEEVTVFENHPTDDQVEAPGEAQPLPGDWPSEAVMHYQNVMAPNRTVETTSSFFSFDVWVSAHTDVEPIWADPVTLDVCCRRRDEEIMIPCHRLRITDEIRVGDWVRFTGHGGGEYINTLSHGWIGKVVRIIGSFMYSVDFGSDIGGHACNGDTAQGHGQYVDITDLELV